MSTTTLPQPKSRLEKVISELQSRDFDFDSATEYGEPGYSTDKPIILFANWNDLTKSELKAVESVAEIEWSDEWVQDDKGRAFRSQPDSYGWECSWFLHDGEIVPFDSITQEGDDLVETLRDYGFLSEPGDNGDFKALPSDISQERIEAIATLYQGDLETGLHPGQNARPEDILKDAPEGEYLFRITGKGQFDVSWEAWKIKASE